MNKTTKIALTTTLLLATLACADEVYTLPGSGQHYTLSQINNFYDAPDWYPDSHPPMPKIVKRGTESGVRACATCHMTSGVGRPESANISGLSSDYIFRQLKAFKQFHRSGVMLTVLRTTVSDQELREAADYFASLPSRNVQVVQEVEHVPVTSINRNFMRVVEKPHTDGKTPMEPIGERIITVAEDEYRITARDPFATYITYVPKGYLEQGKKIVTEGNQNSAPCTSCHGADLRGTEIAPMLAGQYPTYLILQMREYKEGVRRGSADPDGVMATNMKYFTDREIQATAAYLASLSREK